VRIFANSIQLASREGSANPVRPDRLKTAGRGKEENMPCIILEYLEYRGELSIELVAANAAASSGVNVARALLVDGVWRGAVECVPGGLKRAYWVTFRAPHSQILALIERAKEILPAEERAEFRISLTPEGAPRGLRSKNYAASMSSCPYEGHRGAYYLCSKCGAPYRAAVEEVDIFSEENIHLSSAVAYPVRQL
jgi:hypothetical protein